MTLFTLEGGSFDVFGHCRSRVSPLDRRQENYGVESIDVYNGLLPSRARPQPVRAINKLIPYDLIGKIVRFRVVENLKKAKEKPRNKE